MSRAENRANTERMKRWAIKQAQREIASYEGVNIGGALKRHVNIESWIKRADHPQSKAAWKRKGLDRKPKRCVVNARQLYYE